MLNPGGLDAGGTAVLTWVTWSFFLLLHGEPWELYAPVQEDDALQKKWFICFS